MSWRVSTPRATGAIGVIELVGDLERAWRRLCLEPVAVGDCRLRDFRGIDRGLVARVSESHALLMPHGGEAVVRAVCDWLEASGLSQDDEAIDTRFPEASGFIAREVARALSRAASPAAIGLLLKQDRRWRDSPLTPGPESPPPDAHQSAALNRLVAPPLVAAVGASNIGKSTLLNRLAGRSVSVVADEPGTTRDHVGAQVLLDGVAVRWLDLPGTRADADPLETEAMRIASEAVLAADLVLLLGDRDNRPLPDLAAGRPTLSISLRADLGVPDWPFDLAVSARTGEGLDECRSLVAETLVPRRFREAETPWRFW